MKESKNRRILITGATGAVGPRVVRAFCDRGYVVRTFSLDIPQRASIPDGVDVRIGDITDRRALRSAMEDVDGVVHMAALLHIINPSMKLQDEYERVNVDGTRAVVDAATEEGVRRIVLFSTIAVYGSSGNKILTEDTLPLPETLYAKTKLAAERVVLNAKRPDGMPLGVVLRFAAIYGSGIKGNYRRLFKSLSKGRFVPIGRGQNRRTLIYDKDVANVTLLSMEHPEAAGKVYNASDGSFHKMDEIIMTMCKTLGRRPPVLFLPLGGVRFLAYIMEYGARLMKQESSFVRNSIEKYVEDMAVDCGLVQRELGFTPSYDLELGWRETAQEMYANGDL